MNYKLTFKFAQQAQRLNCGLMSNKLLKPLASCDEKYNNICFLQSSVYDKFTVYMSVKDIFFSVSEYFNV